MIPQVADTRQQVMLEDNAQDRLSNTKVPVVC